MWVDKLISNNERLLLDFLNELPVFTVSLSYLKTVANN